MHATTLDYRGKSVREREGGEREGDAPLLFVHCATALKLSAIHLKPKKSLNVICFYTMSKAAKLQSNPPLLFVHLSHNLCKRPNSISTTTRCLHDLEQKVSALSKGKLSQCYFQRCIEKSFPKCFFFCKLA